MERAFSESKRVSYTSYFPWDLKLFCVPMISTIFYTCIVRFQGDRNGKGLILPDPVLGV